MDVKGRSRWTLIRVRRRRIGSRMLREVVLPPRSAGDEQVVRAQETRSVIM